MNASPQYCTCLADGEGFPCGRDLQPQEHASRAPNMCVGCQIARCAAACRRAGKGATDCPARRYGVLFHKVKA